MLNVFMSEEKFSDKNSDYKCANGNQTDGEIRKERQVIFYRRHSAKFTSQFAALLGKCFADFREQFQFVAEQLAWIGDAAVFHQYLPKFHHCHVWVFVADDVMLLFPLVQSLLQISFSRISIHAPSSFFFGGSKKSLADSICSLKFHCQSFNRMRSMMKNFSLCIAGVTVIAALFNATTTLSSSNGISISLPFNSPRSRVRALFLS